MEARFVKSEVSGLCYGVFLNIMDRTNDPIQVPYHLFSILTTVQLTMVYDELWIVDFTDTQVKVNTIQI